MEPITTPAPSEYTAIQRFLEDVYGHGRDHFPMHYCWCWRPENTDYQHIYVIRENGRIASLVRMFPLELEQAGARLKVAGIGAVSTLPSCRGKGHMNRLLKHAIDAMKAEKIPVSILWGDQHRYASFGYQTAGKVIHLTISRRGLEKCRVEPLAPTHFQGQDQLFSSLFRAYQAHPFRLLRTEEECRAAYDHTDLLLYGAGDAERFGYLGLFYKSGILPGVVEFGGNPQTVLQIAANLMERFGIGSLEFRFPRWDLIPQAFVQAASYWKVVPVGQIKILDLEQTLKLLQPQSPQVAESNLPNISKLKSLSELQQVDTLFGTANASPFNLFFWPLDQI